MGKDWLGGGGRLGVEVEGCIGTDVLDTLTKDLLATKCPEHGWRR